MRDARLAVVIALLMARAADGGAQADVLERRVDSLARFAAHAKAAVRAYDDSVRRDDTAIDTAYKGSVTIVAERSIVQEIRVIAPHVVDSVASLVGSGMSRLDGYSFRARVEHLVGWGRRGDTTRELAMMVVRPNGALLRAWRSPVDSANIAASLYYALRHTAFAAVDPSFFAWAGNGIPGETMRASDWADQRLALLSSASAVGNRCFRGDLAACKTALLLTSDPDPIRAWHDTSTRRRLVRRHGAMARRLDPVAEQRCLAGADSACVTVLGLFPAETFREPAPATLRFGLLRHALAVGGTGAVERLLAATADDPAGRLEAASRMPIDSLVGSWQARVRGTRAPSQDLTLGVAIMSLAWVTGIGALSLRSSRWR